MLDTLLEAGKVSVATVKEVQIFIQAHKITLPSTLPTTRPAVRLPTSYKLHELIYTHTHTLGMSEVTLVRNTVSLFLLQSSLLTE